MTHEQKSDAKLALIVTLVVFLVGVVCGRALAWDGCHEHKLKGVKDKCFENITFPELIAYLEKVESLDKK